MDELQMIIDFYKDLERQGPGSRATTLRALEYLPCERQLESILDIGCGTGAATLVLAEQLSGKVIAIDILREFLEIVRKKSSQQGFGDRVTALNMSMNAMQFQPQLFDLMWAEGSIYHIGFEFGLSYFKPFLKPGGYLAVSDLVWLTPDRPQEIETYWLHHYPQVATVGQKLEQIQLAGYDLINHFTLPSTDWTQSYYEPAVAHASIFLEKHASSEDALAFVEDFREEAHMYDIYGNYYGYEFFIMGKPQE